MTHKNVNVCSEWVGGCQYICLYTLFGSIWAISIIKALRIKCFILHLSSLISFNSIIGSRHSFIALLQQAYFITCSPKLILILMPKAGSNIRKGIKSQIIPDVRAANCNYTSLIHSGVLMCKNLLSHHHLSLYPQTGWNNYRITVIVGGQDKNKSELEKVRSVRTVTIWNLFYWIAFVVSIVQGCEHVHHSLFPNQDVDALLSKCGSQVGGSSCPKRFYLNIYYCYSQAALPNTTTSFLPSFPNIGRCSLVLQER